MTFRGLLNLQVKAYSRPSLGDFDFKPEWSSDGILIITKDARDLKHVSTGVYYILVNAIYIPSLYSLSVTYDSDQFIELTPGILQVGFVALHEIDLYRLELPPDTDLNITISISYAQGSPDLYAKLCSYPNQTCSFATDPEHNYDAVHATIYDSGTETISIPHNKTQCPAVTCKYVIGVYCLSTVSSTYEVQASYDENTLHVLTQGKAMDMVVPTGQSRFFMYTVLRPDVENLAFHVTRFFGNGGLFCFDRSSEKIRNRYCFDCEKTLFGGDTLTYRRGKDGSSLMGNYYIQAESVEHYTQFSIVAMEYAPTVFNMSIELRAGHVQQDTLTNSEEHYMQIYSFFIHYTNDTAQPIKVTLTPLTGRFNMFISCSPTGYDREASTFTYDWSSIGINRSDLDNSILISTSDPAYKPSQHYQILVTASRWDENNTATYSIVFRSGDGISVLQENVSVIDEVIEDDYNYYMFAVYQQDVNVRVFLTVYSGSSSTCFSYHANVTRPNITATDFYSPIHGSNVFTVEWEWGPSGDWGLHNTCQELPCYIYISVYGWRQATYELKVSLEKNAPELLTLGNPQTGALEIYGYGYYYIIASTAEDIQLILQTISGDSDLYVNVVNYTSDSINTIESFRPNRSAYMFASQSGSSFDRITLLSENLTRLCSSGSCIMILSVYCRSIACKFIVYAQQDALMLLEGVPFYGVVPAHQTNYFKFFNSIENGNVQVQVTSMNDEPLWIYVSRGSESRPNATNHDWVQEPWSQSPFILSYNDTRYPNSTNMWGYYVVGITSNNLSSFIITVSSSFSAAVQLLPGLPFEVFATKNHIRNFTFHNSHDLGVTVRINPTEGAVEMSIWVSDDGNSPELPENRLWSTSTSESLNEIHISKDDPNFCFHCDFLISVSLVNCEVAKFIITVLNSFGLTVLQNGVPVQSNVDQGTIQLFMFDVRSRFSFDVAVTTFSGDADLYVGLNQSVGPEMYEWKSVSIEKVEHVHVADDDQKFRIGTYYIAVFGSKDSSFSTTAHMRESYIHLIDGWPQVYSIENKNTDHLFFDFQVTNNASGRLWCTLKPIIKNFHPRVYLSFQEVGMSAQKPDPNRFDKAFEKRSEYDNAYGELTIINDTTAKGKFNMGVYGRSDDRAEIGVFTLTCTNAADPAVLREGAAGFGILNEDRRHKRYVLKVEQTGILDVSVVPCSGRVQLEISSNHTYAQNLGPDVLIVTLFDGKLLGTVPNASGTYYITVTMLSPSDYFSGASFEISAKVSTYNKPRTKVQAGGDGIITWKLISSHRIRLSWDPPEHENGTIVSKQRDVRYRIFFTNILNFSLKTVCGIHTGELNSLISQPADPPLIGQTVFVLYVPEVKPLLVNIVAYTDIDDEEVAVPYTTIELDLQHGRRRGVGWIWMGVIAGIFGVVLVCILILVKKYKRKRRRLEFELSERRNDRDTTVVVREEVPPARPIQKSPNYDHINETE